VSLLQPYQQKPHRLKLPPRLPLFLTAAAPDEKPTTEQTIATASEAVKSAETADGSGQ